MHTGSYSTVVLIGFSTAGKSTFLKRASGAFGDRIQCLDSDKWIAQSFDKEHIFEIFMQQGRDLALQQIAEKENHFLDTFSQPQSRSTLIAAGPFIPMRPSWTAYVTEIRPYIIHLTISPEDVYEGLMHRRRQHAAMVDAGHEVFGSWDKDITTTWYGSRYVQLPKEVAIENISRSMAAVVPTYQQFQHISFPGGEHASHQAIEEEIYTRLGIK